MEPMPVPPAERLLFRIPVNYGTGKNAEIQTRDPHSSPWLYFWVLCVMVMNITVCHKVQSNTMIMPKGLVMLRSSG